MKNEKILPFANETKKFKDEFTQIIDEMPDEASLDMMFFLINSEFYGDLEEDFEEDFAKDFESPFSGEMNNLKCPDCKKISAYPIGIVNDIYGATKKEPQVDCYHCEIHSASPIYYKTPNGKTKIQKRLIYCNIDYNYYTLL